MLNLTAEFSHSFEKGLYGEGNGKDKEVEAEKPATGTSVVDSDLCSNPDVDLVVTVEKEIYAFKGNCHLLHAVIWA